MTGQAAFEYISEAVRLALAGDIQAVVTAPIHISLREVSKLITRSRILKVIELAHQSHPSGRQVS